MTSRRYPSEPRAAVAALIVSEGRVLVARRSNPPSAGDWSIPGGAQELSETVEAALRREVREETGLRVEHLRLLDVGDVIVRDEESRVQYHYVIVYYRAQPAGGALRPGDDVSAVRWVTLAEAQSLGMSPRLLNLLAQALGVTG